MHREMNGENREREYGVYMVSKMELPYFKIRFKITKEWLKSAFFDLDMNIKVTEEMLEEISTKMQEWMWNHIATPGYMDNFYDDWNEALYDIIDYIGDEDESP